MDSISWPPSYVVVPVELARAPARGVDGRLVSTMLAVQALCWDQEATPPLPPADLACALGLSRAGLYRHLARLGEEEGGLGWLRTVSQGRRLSLVPLLRLRAVPDPGRFEAGPDLGRFEARPDLGRFEAESDLARALAAIGVEEPKRSELAQQAIDPLWVRAWYLWSRDPARRHLANPAGAVIHKLEQGAPPPGKFLRAARAELAPPPVALADKAPPPAGPLPGSPAALWQQTLAELARCLYRPIFDLHLHGSYVDPGSPGDDDPGSSAADDRLTVTVLRAASLPWLNGRLAPLVRRYLAQCAGRQIEVQFVAR